MLAMSGCRPRRLRLQQRPESRYSLLTNEGVNRCTIGAPVYQLARTSPDWSELRDDLSPRTQPEGVGKRAAIGLYQIGFGGQEPGIWQTNADFGRLRTCAALGPDKGGFHKYRVLSSFHATTITITSLLAPLL